MTFFLDKGEFAGTISMVALRFLGIDFNVTIRWGEGVAGGLEIWVSMKGRMGFGCTKTTEKGQRSFLKRKMQMKTSKYGGISVISKEESVNVREVVHSL